MRHSADLCSIGNNNQKSFQLMKECKSIEALDNLEMLLRQGPKCDNRFRRSNSRDSCMFGNIPGKSSQSTKEYKWTEVIRGHKRQVRQELKRGNRFRMSNAKDSRNWRSRNRHWS
jgi:phosphoglycerate dehydrogenase-like enzyme